MNHPNDTVDETIEQTILKVLDRDAPCWLDDLLQQLPHRQWNEIFAAVDQMSRDGRLVLRRVPGSPGYHLSLPLSPPAQTEGVLITSLPVRFCVGCGYLCDEIHPEGGETQWMDAHQYLTKYRFRWSALNRIDDTCPHCARVLACGYQHTSADASCAETSAT